MATVTGYTAEKMDEIANECIIGGAVVGNNLHLTQRDGTVLDVGSVIGPQGPPGSADASIVVCTSGTRPGSGVRFTGMAIYESDTRRFYIWNGGAWEYRGGLFICTSTTRPASPFGGLVIFEVDTNLFYVWDSNSGSWSYCGGNFIRTSTTRPGSPIEGLLLYETDTDRFEVYNGTRWAPPWNMPWGFVASAQVTGSDQTVGNTPADVTGATVTFTSVGNRRYKISAEMLMISTAAYDTLTGFIVDGAGTLLKRFYQEIYLAAPSGPGGIGDHQGSGFVIVTPGQGTVTYKLQAYCSSGGATIRRSFGYDAPLIMVEDIGPNGAAM